MLEWIVQREFRAAAALYWIFSAAVSSMPEPNSRTGAAYLWIFRFLHTLAGNVTTVFGRRIRGGLFTLALVLPLAISASACTHYTVHPGAVNATDSAAYDALLMGQATIDQARTAYQAGQLPSSAKAPLDTLIQAYNIARTTWLTYRGAVATNQPAGTYLQQLNTNIADLIAAIQAMKEVQ